MTETRCKNCGLEFKTDHNYCESCGAKVIRNRLTLKNVWDDVAENVFNFDHSFWRTVVDLTLRPGQVMQSYFDGVRKRYMNPIAYIGIAITLSGIMLLLMRKVLLEGISFELPGMPAMDPEVMSKIMQVTMDFNTFVFILYIPVIAISGWLVFNQKGFNFTEYLVAGIYILAHFSILTTPISTLILYLKPDVYMFYSLITIVLMATYALFVLNSMDKASILRSILFLMLFGIGYLGMGIMLNLVLLATGVLDLSEFLPKPPPPS